MRPGTFWSPRQPRCLLPVLPRGWGRAGGEGGPGRSRGRGLARGERLFKLNPHLGMAQYPTCGVLKRKTPESDVKASWFGTPSPAPWEGLIDRFLAPGIGILASSKKESLKCTF